MIRIVTDSTADIPTATAQDLGISVVPLYVRFGDEVFRERVDITEEEFYQKLLHGAIHPATIQPSPQDFVQVYEEVAAKADGILSIHITSKLSGTYSSAIQAKKLMGDKCPIEVVDSQTLTMTLGMLVMAAAEAANAGQDLQQVLAGVQRSLTNTHTVALLDTLKYLAKGGRIGKAKALLGSMLSVKPVISVRDGEIMPFAQARSRTKGIELLFDFVSNATDVEDLAVLYSTIPEDAETLAQRLASVFTKKEIRLARLGTTLGVHAGPRSLIVCLLCKIAGSDPSE